MQRTIDCIVCGLVTVDIVARPVALDVPVGKGRLVPLEQFELSTGGMVSNSGIALARLGMRTAVLGYVGDDDWGQLVRRRYQEEGLDTIGLRTYPQDGTSATIVLVDPAGDRSFLFRLGASERVDLALIRAHRDLFERSRMMLFGYYGLTPAWDQQLPHIMQEIHDCGCKTALDAVGDGGRLEPLGRILPHVDAYVPSWQEAQGQTGCSDPRDVIRTLRRFAPHALLGVKLGARGALLSPHADEYIEIAPVTPPGPIVDTTGAGDAFYAGLLAGLLNNLSPGDAGRLAAAAGACSVAAIGASAGVRSYRETEELAK